MSDETKYVVVAANSNMSAFAYGTGTGRVFTSEAAAERTARRIERTKPGLSCVAVPLQHAP